MGDEENITRNKRNADIAVKRSALVNAARFLDTEIIKHEEAVSETISSARQSLSTATNQAIQLSVSYGQAVLVASVFYAENVICGKPIANFTNTDWKGNIGNQY